MKSKEPHEVYVLSKEVNQLTKFVEYNSYIAG